MLVCWLFFFFLLYSTVFDGLCVQVVDQPIVQAQVTVRWDMRTGQLTAIHVNSAFRLHRDVAHLCAKMMRERSPADMWRRHPANQSPAHCEICSEGKSPRGLIRICPGHMYVYAHNLLINVIAAHVGGDPSSLRGGSICLPSLSTAEAGCFFFFLCVLSLNLPVSRVNQKHGPTSGKWTGEKKKKKSHNKTIKRSKTQKTLSEGSKQNVSSG